MTFTSTGITRPVDNLGRVVIPKELRESGAIEEKDRLEFQVCPDHPDLIVLKKVQDRCAICGSSHDLVIAEFGTAQNRTTKSVCTACMKQLQQIVPL